jgi:uncharacterized protein
MSPTDLTRFFESEFASWMDHYELVAKEKGPLEGVHRNPPDELQTLLAEKGNAHELDVLAQFEARGEVLRLERRNDEDTAVRIAKTLEAMKTGAPFIYQAALEGDTFFGYADLLERVPGESNLGDFHYQPLDMKISVTPKPTAIIQLCAYADALQSIQGCLPKELRVITRDGEEHRYATDRFFSFYKFFKKRFIEFHKSFNLETQPLPQKNEEHRDWSIYARKVLHEKDDIQLTARIRRNHVEALKGEGISTLTALSKIGPLLKIEGLPAETLKTLQHQAELQVKSREAGKLLYEILPHQAGQRIGLAMLPDPHPQDLFFDMEGYPILGKNGLEYLYGIAARGSGKTEYKEIWAKKIDQEFDAFSKFMKYAHALWLKNPGMHIYHYGHYEPSTLKRLMGRYGRHESHMDDLLRAEVFVDLYQVVLQGLRIGAFSYGLKAIEKLYYPERETEISSGAESAIEFSHYLETGEEKFLDKIRDYNRDDCYSAKDLESFLREIKESRRIAYVPSQSEEWHAREADPDSIREQCSRRAQELLAGIPIEKRGLSFEQAYPGDSGFYIQELLAHMLDFHRREDNPDWWEYFRRKDLAPEQLYDEPSVLFGVRFIASNSEGHFECKFDSRQDCKFKEDDEVLILENNNPFESLEIVEWNQLEGSLTLSGKRIEIPSGPFTLAPAKSNIKKDALLASLLEQANQFNIAHIDYGLRPSVCDLLLRRPPKIAGIIPGEPIIEAGEDVVDGSIRAVTNMEGGCLCIQGPPGSGKTTTASKMIASLLRSGKSVAISSNSHKAISNLLKKVDLQCESNRSFCRPVKLTSVRKLEEESLEYSDCIIPVRSSSTSINVLFGSSAKPLYREGPANLVGATAFYFCKEEHVDRFDYLFIDEATQVCLPNLVAMARCSQNIMLMGDQMQLEAPSQGTHPGDSGHSGLVHLTHGKPVIAAHEGIFLPVTYRMHSRVNDVVSSLFYNNELKSHRDNDTQQIIWKKSQEVKLPSSGVIFYPVEHSGNTHGSKEEAQVLKEIMDAALNSKWTNKSGKMQNLTKADILVVTPYNFQVSLLKQHLGTDARIGTVDIFQGQEAPLVLVSLCASTIQDAPRGISFLLQRNRMNVAISRAKCLSVVVGSPLLFDGKPSTTNNIELLNIICNLKSND